MTTLNLPTAGTARTELSGKYHAAISRMGRATSCPPVNAVHVQSIGPALAGSDSSTSIDLSSLTRAHKAQLVLDLRSIVAETTNNACLKNFADAIEAEYGPLWP